MFATYFGSKFEQSTVLLIFLTHGLRTNFRVIFFKKKSLITCTVRFCNLDLFVQNLFPPLELQARRLILGLVNAESILREIEEVEILFDFNKSFFI